jgi:hypothetical protein
MPTVVACPRLATAIKAVAPSPYFASTSAPASNKASTIECRPLPAATIRAVRPSSLLAFTSTPCSSKPRTFPNWQAAEYARPDNRARVMDRWLRCKSHLHTRIPYHCMCIRMGSSLSLGSYDKKCCHSCRYSSGCL